MSVSQPQAAVAATLAMGKVLGLVIDKAQVMQGTPAQFYGSAEDEDRARYERIRERIGSKGADRLWRCSRICATSAASRVRPMTEQEVQAEVEKGLVRLFLEITHARRRVAWQP
jgi:hypothetical protein